MNIAIVAKFKDVETWEFDVYQTPTNVSYEIEKAEDPIDSYCQWVLKTYEPYHEEEEIYDDDTGAIIGKETIIRNPATEHIKELKDWIELTKKLGFEIEIYVR